MSMHDIAQEIEMEPDPSVSPPPSDEGLSSDLSEISLTDDGDVWCDSFDYVWEDVRYSSWSTFLCGSSIVTAGELAMALSFMFIGENVYTLACSFLLYFMLTSLVVQQKPLWNGPGFSVALSVLHAAFIGGCGAGYMLCNYRSIQFEPHRAVSAQAAPPQHTRYYDVLNFSEPDSANFNNGSSSQAAAFVNTGMMLRHRDDNQGIDNCIAPIMAVPLAVGPALTT